MEREALTICGMTFWHLDRPGVASVLETGVYFERDDGISLVHAAFSLYGEKEMLFCKDPHGPGLSS